VPALVLCALACWVVVSSAASEYGQPGEEFIGLRYPLEAIWTVESNPAFLPLVDRISTQGTFFPNFESSYLATAGVFVPLRTTLGFPNNRSGSSSFALIVHTIGSSDMDGRDANNNALGSFSDSKAVFSLLYGHKLTPNISVGGGMKYISYNTSTVEGSALSDKSTSAFGTDIGITISPTEDVDLGLSVSNAPFRPDVTLVSEQEKWPMIGHLDAGLRLMDGRLQFSAGLDYIQNDQRGDGGSIVRPEGGLNYRINGLIAVGGGYGNGEPSGGVQISVSNMNFQYSLENSDLGLLHYFSVGLAFGSTGEERYAALAEGLPDRLFAEALRAYKEGRYYEAADKFSCFCDRFPDDERVDQALNYTGLSFEGFGAKSGGQVFYQRLVDERTDSPLRADAMGRIVELRYELGDFAGALEQYNLLSEMYTTSNATYSGRYFAGMCKYHEGDFKDAIRFLESVPSNSESYLFAQYGLGLCHLKNPSIDQESAVSKAKDCFSNVRMKRAEITPDEELLRDRAALVLGHLHREIGQYAEAVKRYELVPKGRYYSEACLGAAYCLCDLGDFDSAIMMTDRLLDGRPHNSADYAEALLVKCHCLKRSGQIEAATKLVDELRSLALNATVPSESERQTTIADLERDIGACKTVCRSAETAYVKVVRQSDGSGPSDNEMTLRTDMKKGLRELTSFIQSLDNYMKRVEDSKRLQDVSAALINL